MCTILTIISTISIKKNISHIKDTEQTLLILDSIIQNYHTIAKDLDIYDFRYRIDSVYTDGNTLLKNYNNPKFKELYANFLNEYGRYIVVGNKRDTYNYTAIQTKLMQIQYIFNTIKWEHESYFQVDAISVRAANPAVNYNKTNQLKLFIYYKFLHDHKEKLYPLVEIDGDTLFYDYPFYYYNYFGEEKGEHLIEANISVNRWGKIHSFSSAFKVIVE